MRGINMTIEEELDYTAQVMSKQAFWGAAARLGLKGLLTLGTIGGGIWGINSLNEARHNANAASNSWKMIRKNKTSAQSTPGVQYMTTTPQDETKRLSDWQLNYANQ